MATVFISYSHDSEEHKQRVWALAERLRGALSASGVRIVIDQDMLPGGPDEGWLDWSERQVCDADRVLVVCSEPYRDSYDGRTPPGTGLGVAWEAGLIKQLLYDARVNAKFRVVLFPGENAGHVPLGLKRYHAFQLWQGEDDLIAWLRGGATPLLPGTPITIRWPDAPIAFPSRLADRSDEFERFKRMLRGRSEQRILLLQGPSGRGKTALLTRCLEFAVLLRVAHAKVDLKGCPPLARVLGGIAGDLGHLLPSYGGAAHDERPRALLRDLALVGEPVVLVFDTYEQSSNEVRLWIETQLLDRVWRCPGLIVLVAGQQVPDAREHGWERQACTLGIPAITHVDDWVEFCTMHHARAIWERGELAKLVVAAQGEPRLISQLLENYTQSLPPVKPEPLRP